jgi:hypothetical protein
MFCNNGIEIPTPAACINRPINKVEKFGATKQVIVPIKKIVIAVKYNLFELNLLISQALMGIIIPFTSKKPVVSH